MNRSALSRYRPGKEQVISVPHGVLAETTPITLFILVQVNHSRDIRGAAEIITLAKEHSFDDGINCDRPIQSTRQTSKTHVTLVNIVPRRFQLERFLVGREI